MATPPGSERIHSDRLHQGSERTREATAAESSVKTLGRPTSAAASTSAGVSRRVPVHGDRRHPEDRRNQEEPRALPAQRPAPARPAGGDDRDAAGRPSEAAGRHGGAGRCAGECPSRQTSKRRSGRLSAATAEATARSRARRLTSRSGAVAGRWGASIIGRTRAPGQGGVDQPLAELGELNPIGTRPIGKQGELGQPGDGVHLEHPGAASRRRR